MGRVSVPPTMLAAASPTQGALLTQYAFKLPGTVGPNDAIAIAGPDPVAPTIVVPSAVQSLIATLGSDGISASLSWVPPASNGGDTAALSYGIYLAAALVGTVAVPPYVVTGLTRGTTYTWSVAAHNSAGYGPLTAVSLLIPATVPGMPQNITATLGSDGKSAILNWQVPTNNGGSPVTGYIVPSADNSTTSTITTTTYTEAGLTQGASYSWGVQAVNAVGSGAPAIVTITVPAPPPPSSGAGVITPVPPPHFATAFGGYPQHAPINSTIAGSAGQLLEYKNMTFRGAIGTTGAALRVQYYVGDIYIHDCDFDSLSWSAINILSCTGTLRIEYCRYKEQTRNFVQIASQCSLSGHISNNKGKGGLTEDIVNINSSSGHSSTDPFYVEHNSFEGTDWTSGSGSGIALADAGGSHLVARYNTLLSVGQVGAFISNGTDNHITDNVIYGAKRAGSNVGIYTPYGGYGATNPGGHEVARNRVMWFKPDGTQNNFWNGGASGTVAGLNPQTNTFGDTTINPASLAVTL